MLTREEILLALERMQAGTGHPLSALNPMVEVRLPHARVTAVHERLALGGPSLTIRLRSRALLPLIALLQQGMLPPAGLGVRASVWPPGRHHHGRRDRIGQDDAGPGPARRAAP